MNRRGFFGLLAALGLGRYLPPPKDGVRKAFKEYLEASYACVPTSNHWTATTYGKTFTVSAAALSDTNYHSISEAFVALRKTGGGTIVLAPGHHESFHV